MKLQNWVKRQLLFPQSLSQGASHMSVPVVIQMGDVVRIFYSARNQEGRSLPYFFDYSMETQKVLQHSVGALLELGGRGTFDADGVMPTSIIKKDKGYYMYYIGWNRGVDVPFRNSIGMASSTDLLQWSRTFDGPVLDRSPSRPYFTASSEVVIHDGTFRMYFLNCLGWEKSGKDLRHRYHIQIATSSDGIHWLDDGDVAIGFANEQEYAISRPCVIKTQDKWNMWYSYRGSELMDGYRIGYAQSEDGMIWERQDSAIHLHKDRGAWETEMQCYPCVFCFREKYYMLYNGNGYGQTGIGMAELEGDLT